MSNKNPLISIIVPAFNAEEFIEENIKSLMRQTYKNIEIIVVNDGSNDKTLDIINELSIKDVRIVVIDKENGGVSSARIAGFNKAKGKYIMYVDSDDYVDSDYVDYFYHLINANGVDYDMAVNYNRYSIYEKKQVKEEKVAISDANDIVVDIYVSRIHEAVWNKIYKRSFLKRNKITFNNEIWYGEGMLYNVQCLQAVDEVPVGNRRVYHQRFNKKSAMRNFSMESNICGLRSMDLQRKSWKKSNKKMLNAWLFHRYCYNMSIIKGVIKTNTKNKYTKEYNECIKNMHSGWLYPWRVNIPFARKAYFIMASWFPTVLARAFVLNEKRKSKEAP